MMASNDHVECSPHWPLDFLKTVGNHKIRPINGLLFWDCEAGGARFSSQGARSSVKSED
jgi:hypothetical protein